MGVGDMSSFLGSGLVKIEVRKTGVAGMKPADFNRIRKACFFDVATWWIKVCMPKHFTVAGGKEYGYLPRSPWYLGEKQDRMGHTNPLVWTGEARSDARRTARAESTSKGGKAVINVPKLNWRKAARPGRGFWRASKIHMADELRTVSRRERVQASRLFNKFLEMRLNKAEKQGLAAAGQAGLAAGLATASAYAGAGIGSGFGA